MGNGVTVATVTQTACPAGISGDVTFDYASVQLVGRVFRRVTNYLDIDEARAAVERLAEEQG